MSMRSVRRAAGSSHSARCTASSRGTATRSRRQLRMRSSPSASAWRLTLSEPGTTQAGTTARPFLRDRSGHADIIEPAVRARADENAIDGDLGQRHSGAQAHIVQCFAELRPAFDAALARGIGNARGDRQRLLRIGAPGHRRRDGGRIERHLLVEGRARVGRQGAPKPDRLVPGSAFRRERAIREILIGGRRPARSGRRGRRPQSTCCRSSSAHSSTSAQSWSRHTRSHARWRRQCRSWRLSRE